MLLVIHLLSRLHFLARRIPGSRRRHIPDSPQQQCDTMVTEYLCSVSIVSRRLCHDEHDVKHSSQSHNDLLLGLVDDSLPESYKKNPQRIGQIKTFSTNWTIWLAHGSSMYSCETSSHTT